MNTCLMSTGSTCYPNNILIAQVWTTLLTTSFELDTWGAWTQPILSMFTIHAGEAHNPCHGSFLGRLLEVWFTSHDSIVQHDAGEFACWMRAQIFEKKLMPGGILTSYAWDSRLTSTTEDSGYPAVASSRAIFERPSNRQFMDMLAIGTTSTIVP